ncbi:MAG: PAS domain-containing protein [Vicinamibacterales bacterium]
MKQPNGLDPSADPGGKSLKEELYELLVTHLPSSAVMMFDHDLRFVLADGPELARTGTSKAALEGRPLYDAVDPAFAALVEPNLRAALAGRRFRAELPFGDATYAYAYVPVPDASGEIRYALVMAQDVTDLRRAEQRAVQSEARLRDLVGSLPAVVFAVGADRRLRFVDGMGLQRLGVQAANLVGLPADEAYLGDPKDLKGLNAALAGERVVEDLPIRGRVFETRHLPVTGPDGGVTEVVGIAVDVTEQRRFQALDLQRQKLEAIGRLAGGIAHDFNNMLTVILGNAEQAIAGAAPGTALYDQMAQIRHAAEHSARLTRRLLAFGRKQVVKPRVLDVNHSVASALVLLGRLLGENVELTWRPGTAVWPVEADPDQLEQVLTNLCLNARDAIADVGHVTVTTENVTLSPEDCAGHPEFVPGDFVRLTVADDGRGMSEETLRLAFEPFFSTKDASESAGLGLATVLGIVKQCGGFVTATSAPGEGATFHVYLPRTARRRPAPPPPADAPAAPSVGTETVLLVEDEASVLRLERRALEKLGYTVIAADGPEKALRLAAEAPGPIHLLITDVVMPGMNGRELARRLRGAAPDLRVLFVSGYADTEVADDRVPARDGFLLKPFTLGGLASRIREVLDR